jgi:hypothetical protein
MIHIPLVIRNLLRDFKPHLVFLAYRKALVPARKTKTGAQKCVIHLVKKKATEVWAGSTGLKAEAPINNLT